MTRRTKWVAGAVVSLAVVVAGGVWLATRPVPCLATFRQVTPGMTRGEVYATVGGPPRSYLTDAGGVYDLRGLEGDRHKEQWLADDGCLFVAFGADDVAEVVSHGERLQSLR